MDEIEGESVSTPRSSMFYIAGAAVIIYVALSAWMIIDLRMRVDKAEKAQVGAAAQTLDLMKRMGMTEANLKASTATLASNLGMTQKDLSARAAELQRQQRAAEQRITDEQRQKFTAVTGEVAGVKTELGGAKTDIATTKTDLEQTKSRLERALGDLGVQSGLIAHTREDLEFLKHKGDRNYFEFTLEKNKRAPISTVSLELKKTDSKKGRFTLNVLADDRTIEKKDRSMNEPMQFYTGRDRMLYEVVVFTVDKNKISGYLSTPKTAPEPVSR